MFAGCRWISALLLGFDVFDSAGCRWILVLNSSWWIMGLDRCRWKLALMNATENRVLLDTGKDWALLSTSEDRYTTTITKDDIHYLNHTPVSASHLIISRCCAYKLNKIPQVCLISTEMQPCWKVTLQTYCHWIYAIILDAPKWKFHCLMELETEPNFIVHRRY